MCKEITVQEAIRQLNRYDCEFYTPANRTAHRMAIEAIREQEERNNPKPLTIDELMKMNGQPIYVVCLKNGMCFWDVIFNASKYNCFMQITGSTGWELMGDTWIAYRYKPNEEQMDEILKDMD